MRLRSKIFRQMLLLALVPSVIVAAVSFYLMTEALKQTGGWFAGHEPDRTINAMRVLESRLQEDARTFLENADPETLEPAASSLDWLILYRGDVTVSAGKTQEFSHEIDSVLHAGFAQDGEVRKAVGGNLIFGYVVKFGEGRLGGGYIMGPDYLAGLDAASQSLSGRREIQNILPGYIMFLAATTFLVLVLMVVFAWFMSRRLSRLISRPLETLTEFTGRMAGSDEPGRIEIAGTDEIINLADAFNRMAVDLRRSRERLQAAQRVAAWQEFARRMAHELKNPLTPITLSLYRIKKNLTAAGQYDKYAESLNAITSEVEHLERMATDYGNLAKMPDPHPRQFDLNLPVSDLIKLHQEQLAGFEFETMLSRRKLTVFGDPDRIREALLNLIKNAIEFTPEGKMIIITTTGDEHTARFSVLNDVADMETINFSSARLPYYTTRRGGSGLGLAIAEKIIIDAGGTLSFQMSEGMVEARIELPLEESGD